ncbi:NepR family anti-sigma factor [Roseovarius aquimarinus]|uniref:NepR family anti-sigma factor n=1 Tax=Roseovarius aquimarinus TaxID=1229156 RepID=A0ABW7I782_9RHOB
MKRDEDGGNADGAPSRKAPKRDQIDENLKRVYNEMLEQDVPDRFEELLRQLREQDKS